MAFSGSEKRASRYLHRSETTPCEGTKRYRSRSPLTRSDQEDKGRKWSDPFPEPPSKPSQSKQQSVITAPLSFELQASPLSTSRLDGDEVRASRYLHRSETTPCEGTKRYRSRSPLTRSDQEDKGRKWSDRFPEPPSKPSQSKQQSVITAPLSFELQASPLSTSKLDGDEVRGSKDASQNGRVARKRNGDEQNGEHLSKRLTLSESQCGFIAPLLNVLFTSGSTGPSQKVCVPEKKMRVCYSGPSSSKGKEEEHQDSKCPHKSLRKEDSASPFSITSGLRAMEGSADLSQKGHIAQKSKEDMPKTQQSCLKKMPGQPRKESSWNSGGLPSYSKVQAQEENVLKAQSDESDLHSTEGLPYIQGPKLGEGGFGTVYAGTRISDGLEVAIKYVPKESALKVEDSQTGSMPLEVALMLRVSSPPACPNIVRIFEWFEQPEYYVLIMERPDPCEDLEKYSDRSKHTDEEMAKVVILQLVNALKHCESRGVLHRDVKPDNVLICTDTGELKLLDFGCGDFLKDSYGDYAGTPLYAPPELFRFGRYQARPTTVWSVGITLYEVLFGSIPFFNTQNIIKQRLSLPTFLSKECRHLLRWCLRKSPDKRPSLEEIERHPWFH